MGETQGEKNIMEFTFYFITVIVLSEAWMETKAHTQTYKATATKAAAPLCLAEKKAHLESK